LVDVPIRTLVSVTGLAGVSDVDVASAASAVEVPVVMAGSLAGGATAVFVSPVTGTDSVGRLVMVAMGEATIVGVVAGAPGAQAASASINTTPGINNLLILSPWSVSNSCDCTF
jgi:hypothetical protein